MSTDAHAEALKAYLTAAAKAPVLDLDEIKTAQQDGTLAPQYVELYLAPRFGGQARADGSRATSLRRLSTRVVATTVTNARLIEDRITEAFRLTTVDLGDVHVQVSYESGGGAFGYDDGFYTALTDWTFVA